jgi:hypothetical protein
MQNLGMYSRLVEQRPRATPERTASARVRLGGQTDTCHTGPPYAWAVYISMSQVSITLRPFAGRCMHTGSVKDVIIRYRPIKRSIQIISRASDNSHPRDELRALTNPLV